MSADYCQRVSLYLSAILVCAAETIPFGSGKDVVSSMSYLAHCWLVIAVLVSQDLPHRALASTAATYRGAAPAVPHGLAPRHIALVATAAGPRTRPALQSRGTGAVRRR